MPISIGRGPGWVFTCEGQATGHVAAQYGHLLPGDLTPAGVVTHHSYDRRLDRHTENIWCVHHFISKAELAESVRHLPTSGKDGVK